MNRLTHEISDRPASGRAILTVQAFPAILAFPTVLTVQTFPAILDMNAQGPAFEGLAGGHGGTSNNRGVHESSLERPGPASGRLAFPAFLAVPALPAFPTVPTQLSLPS